MKKFLLSVLITLLTVCCFGLFAACDEAGTPFPSIPIPTPGGGDGGGDSGEKTGGLQNGGNREVGEYTIPEKNEN